MSDYGKWVGGAVGWALGGPIGGILGYQIGKMFKGFTSSDDPVVILEERKEATFQWH